MSTTSFTLCAEDATPAARQQAEERQKQDILMEARLEGIRSCQRSHSNQEGAAYCLDGCSRQAAELQITCFLSSSGSSSRRKQGTHRDPT